MTHASLNHRRRAATAGFTLVEILIAVSIIVLMIGLALPAFRAITGSRSVEGATNNVSAMLARARTDAVGLQVSRGVAFFTDSTNQCRMAEVGPVQFPAWSATAAYRKGDYASRIGPILTGTASTYGVCIQTVPANSGSAATALPLPNSASVSMSTAYWHVFVDNKADHSYPPPTDSTYLTSADYLNSDLYCAINGIFFDQLPDTDTVPLPLGIAAQTIADGGAPASGVARTTDGYLHVGVLAFDSVGRLAQQSTVLSQFGPIGATVNLGANVAINATTTPPLPKGATAPVPIPSQFGLVLYDRDAHDALYRAVGDPTYTPVTFPAYTSGTPSPSDEETWLDANATPLLIDRYTGTLIRGE